MPFAKELFISRTHNCIVRRKQREGKEKYNVLLPQTFRNEVGEIFILPDGREVGLPEKDLINIFSLEHGKRLLKEGLPPLREEKGKVLFSPMEENFRPKPAPLSEEAVRAWKLQKGLLPNS